MRIVFIGCVKSSSIFLQKLIEMKEDLVGVVTKAESAFHADFVDLGSICRDNNIDYIQIQHVNDIQSKKYIKSKKPDLILCLGWSQLLDEEVLHIPRLGCIGFHPAELPYNRGRHPLIWALVLGLEKTASSFFLMDADADRGRMVSQKYVDIDISDDAASLYDKVMDAAVIQLGDILSDFKKHKVAFIEYEAEGNLWRKRGKEDGRIDWRMSSRGIYNLVRALTKPYLGAHFIYQEKEYKVWKVREIYRKGYENIEPGKVIEVFSNFNFIVKTADGLIEVLECDCISIEMGSYLM
jgi:Methionyl-tRNA formyltransferase